MNKTRLAGKALITGATGFIGGNLMRRLAKEGWEIAIIARPNSALKDIPKNVSVFTYDGSTASVISAMQNAMPDIVFHLASLYLPQHKPEDISSLIASNILFSTQVVEAMALTGVKNLINTGTSWQYFKEERTPVNLYAATKSAFDAILCYYADIEKVKVISLLLFDTYGPGDPRAKLLALLNKTAKSGLELSMSPGKQKINVVFIDDVIDAYIESAKIIDTQVLNFEEYAISSGEVLTLLELVEVFEKTTGSEVAIKWGGLPYRPREVMVPWTSFQTLPGWEPKVSLAEGIKLTFGSIL